MGHLYIPNRCDLLEMIRPGLPRPAVWANMDRDELRRRLGEHTRILEPPAESLRTPRCLTTMRESTLAMVTDRSIRMRDGGFPTTPFPWVRPLVSSLV